MWSTDVTAQDALFEGGRGGKWASKIVRSGAA